MMVNKELMTKLVVGAAAIPMAAGFWAATASTNTATYLADPPPCVDANGNPCAGGPANANAGPGGASASVPGADASAGPGGVNADLPGSNANAGQGGASASVPGAGANAGPGGASASVPGAGANAGPGGAGICINGVGCANAG